MRSIAVRGTCAAARAVARGAARTHTRSLATAKLDLEDPLQLHTQLTSDEQMIMVRRARRARTHR